MPASDAGEPDASRREQAAAVAREPSARRRREHTAAAPGEHTAAAPAEHTTAPGGEQATAAGTGQDDGPEIVIDLTDALRGDRPQVAPDVVRWRWAALLLGATTVVVLGLAIANYVTGMQWRASALEARDRAEQAAADAAARQQAVVQARAERGAAELRREAMAKHLAVSEADVEALEARIATLASDRARAEDHGGGSTPVASDAQLRAVRAQVDSCVAQVAAVRTGLLVGDGELAALHDAARAAEASCEQAGSDLAALGAGE